MSRRSLLVASVAVLSSVTLLFPVGASASTADGDQPGQTIESSATALPGGQSLISDTVLDAAGQVVSTAEHTVANGQFRAAADEGHGFSCVSDGYAPGFRAYDRWEARYRGSNDMAQALFFPYSQIVSRGGAGGDQAQRWLICGVGGADTNNGSRLTKAGPGIAYKQDSTYRIGQNWQVGTTPANYTVSLGFEAAGPVKVTGGISQTPQHKLKGSFRPPQHDRDMDRFAFNGVNGWWEHACEPRCGGNGSPTGSSDYHGSVVEGLWEFPAGKPVRPDDFLMKMYWTHHCATASGICR
jgi:hypothetical protein